MEDKRKRTRKSMLIFAAIVGGFVLLGILFRLTGFMSFGSPELSGAENISERHIGVLYIEGVIGDGDIYNHEYIIDAIDGMMENSRNRGMMLFIETPGGGVYESDEVYLKIREYQETTGRPVYAYLGSQATSGGYYIAAAADTIAANRNCWTGSIGVTIGTLYDISGLMERYGIKSATITSGRNKAMGDITVPLTEEQRQILQSLVDEAYEQFIDVVAEGRSLEKDYVRSISDGRIYTARQAQELMLVDDVVNTYDDALEDMAQEFHLYDCAVYEFRYEPEYDILSSLIRSMDKMSDASSGDIEALTELIESNNELPLQYMCEVTKR